MDKVHKHNSFNTETPSSESYRKEHRNSEARREVRLEVNTEKYKYMDAFRQQIEPQIIIFWLTINAL
jgi:hypothetical protein